MSQFILIGSLSGAVGVLLGAFGAHTIQNRLSQDRLRTFETGVRYQMYHVPGLFGAAFVGALLPESSFVNIAGWLFVAGTVVFSGSLYLLALTGKRWMGAVTPFGGLAFIAGWIFLGLTIFSA